MIYVKKKQQIVYILIPILVSLFYIPYQTVFATTQVNNYQASNINNWNGNVTVEKFSGLSAGQTITSMGINIQGIGNYVSSQNGTTGGASHNQPSINNVHCTKFTGLPANGVINGINTALFNGAGNIRAKIFSDLPNGTAPNILLGESSSTFINTQVTIFTTLVSIPSNGKVWGCFEVDPSSTLNFYFDLGGLPGKTDSHVYGFGPTVFGVPSTETEYVIVLHYFNAPLPDVRFKIYQDDGSNGDPRSLITDSGSIQLQATGKQNFTLSNAVIPASGNVWAGFETDSSNLNLFYSNNIGGVTKDSPTHIFSAGPNPFTTPTTDPNKAYWEQVTYQAFASSTSLILNPPQGPSYTNVLVSGAGFHASSNLNFTFDGSLIIMQSTPQTNNVGAFSGVIINIPASAPGPHNVKACDSTNFCISSVFTLTKAVIQNYASGTQSNNNTSITPIIITDTPMLATSQSIYFSNGTLIQTIFYGAPIPINPLNTQVPLQPFAPFSISSQTTFYENVTTTDAFNSYTTKSQSLTFIPMLSSTHPINQPGTPPTTGNNTNPGNQIIPGNQNFNPTNITPGQQNFTAVNTNTIPITYTRIDKSSSVTYLLVGYPNSFNLTCNLSYQFAQINQTYIKLPHVSIPSNRFQSNFTFTNPNNEVITTNCTDVNTHVSANYILVQNNFPLQQQVKQFRSGQFGTHGQFGVIDIISLIGILAAMIGLSRVNEAAGIIIAVIMLGILSFFQIVTWQTTITGFIAVIVMIAVVSTKKLPWSQ